MTRFANLMARYEALLNQGAEQVLTSEIQWIYPQLDVLLPNPNGEASNLLPRLEFRTSQPVKKIEVSIRTINFSRYPSYTSNTLFAAGGVNLDVEHGVDIRAVYWIDAYLINVTFEIGIEYRFEFRVTANSRMTADEREQQGYTKLKFEELIAKINKTSAEGKVPEIWEVLSKKSWVIGLQSVPLGLVRLGSEFGTILQTAREEVYNSSIVKFCANIDKIEMQFAQGGIYDIPTGLNSIRDLFKLNLSENEQLFLETFSEVWFVDCLAFCKRVERLKKIDFEQAAPVKDEDLSPPVEPTNIMRLEVRKEVNALAKNIQGGERF